MHFNPFILGALCKRFRPNYDAAEYAFIQGQHCLLTAISKQNTVNPFYLDFGYLE